MEKRGIGWTLCISGSCIAILIFFTLVVFYLSEGISLSPPEETHLICIENICTAVPGIGVDECTNEGSFCGCVDTDSEENSSGMNFFVKGTSRNSTDSKTDHCTINGNLMEHFCKNNKTIQSLEIPCGSLGNHTCISGECFTGVKKLTQCVDNDNGLSYQSDSFATNGIVRISDYCTDDGKLAETYCSPTTNEVLIDLFDCKKLGNFTCNLGSCVSDV